MLNQCCRRSVKYRRLPQSIDGTVQPGRLLCQGIIVPENTRTRAQDIPVKPCFQQLEPIHFSDRPIEALCVRIDCAYRQPGEHYDEKCNGGDRRRGFHGGAAATGMPRKTPVNVFRNATTSTTCVSESVLS